MVSIEINDIKNFMSNLLVKDTYDYFLVSEATIVTGSTYNMNGQINKSFYSSDELEKLPSNKYISWSNLRPFCFSLIKGSKTPALLKIIFLLPPNMVEDFLKKNELDYQPSDIKALFVNLQYQNGKLTCITGTSLSFFTLDKSLEAAFDKFISTLFE